jgi:hypothetical protein
MTLWLLVPVHLVPISILVLPMVTASSLKTIVMTSSSFFSSFLSSVLSSTQSTISLNSG